MDLLELADRDAARDLVRGQVEAQVGHVDPALVALALVLVDAASEITIDPDYLPASHWHGTYWIRAGRWARDGVHVPGLAETLAAFTNATTDLRAVALMRPMTSSWVGLLWFDMHGGLVGAIDLRVLTDIAS